MAAITPDKHTQHKTNPIVPNETYLQLNSNAISEDDMKEMEHILEDYCPELYPVTDKTLVFICALSKKYEIPIIKFIISLYSQHVINWHSSPKTNKEAFTLRYFSDNCPFFQYYKRVDHKIYTSFIALMPIVIKRLFCEPIFSYMILDDINEFIEIHRASHCVFTKNSNNHLPLRFDICILPRDVKATRTIDDMEQQIDIGDLHKPFAQYEDEGNDVYHHKIKYSKDIAWLPVLREVVRNACRQWEIEHLLRYERYIMVIDRREKYCKHDIDIWFYEVDEELNQTLPKKHYQYLSLLNLYYSKKFLFPSLRGKPIGLYARSFNIFAISYCLNEANDISSDWIFNGAQLTFDVSDIRHIWPKLFEHDTISPQVSSSLDDFCLTNTQMPCVTYIKSQVTKPIVCEMTDDLCTTNAQMTCGANVKSQVTKPIVCQITDDGAEHTVDTLCDYIKQEMDESFAALISKAIKTIQDEFDDIDDIKEDVEDVECSLILEDFEDEFQEQLKNVIEEHIGTNN